MEPFEEHPSTVQFLYDFKNKSASDKEHLQHIDAHGIIVHPDNVLIIFHHLYTLRKP